MTKSIKGSGPWSSCQSLLEIITGWQGLPLGGEQLGASAFERDQGYLPTLAELPGADSTECDRLFLPGALEMEGSSDFGRPGGRTQPASPGTGRAPLLSRLAVYPGFPSGPEGALCIASGLVGLPSLRGPLMVRDPYVPPRGVGQFVLAIRKEVHIALLSDHAVAASVFPRIQGRVRLSNAAVHAVALIVGHRAEGHGQRDWMALVVNDGLGHRLPQSLRG